MVDFSQYMGVIDKANKVGDEISGYNLPENVAARQNVQLEQQANQMKLRQMQQEMQDKQLAQQAWKTAVEQAKETGESPISIYRKNAANLGYSQAAEVEKYQQDQAKLNAPKFEFIKETGQVVGISPTGETTVTTANDFKIPTKESPPTEVERLLAAQGVQKGSPQWNQTISDFLHKKTNVVVNTPRPERMVAVIDPVTNMPTYVPQSEARGMRPATGPAASGDKPIYDTASNEWVYPPSAEFPQGKRTGDVAKQNALSAATTLINEFKGSEEQPGPIYTTSTGGILGLKGTLSKVTDTQKVKDFNNLKESLSTQLRAIMRIPGEGALSDKEQAQYGLQLPDIGNDPEVNARILDRIQTTMGMRASSVPVAPKPVAAKQTRNLPPRNAQGWTLHTDANGNSAYVSPDGKQYKEVK